MLNVAVVGVGGWGKNLARNYSQIPDCSLNLVCDLNRNRLEELQRQLPGTAITTRFDDLLTDRELQACVIATTASTHYALCAAALRAGKDVFVEKPFVLEVHEAEELVRIAEQEGSILMVGHLLEYHPVVGRLKGMIAAGELGDIYYLYNQRVNLGTVRDDENALWSFADHNADYNTFAEYVTLRFGDITIPHLRIDEPVRLECQHFLECVRDRRRPRSDGRDGLRVVKVLAAAQRSLEKNGTPVPIEAAVYRRVA